MYAYKGMILTRADGNLCAKCCAEDFAYVFLYSQNNEVGVFIIPIFQMKRLRG